MLGFFVCVFFKGHCLKGSPLWERIHENSAEFFKPVTFRHQMIFESSLSLSLLLSLSLPLSLFLPPTDTLWGRGEYLSNIQFFIIHDIKIFKLNRKLEI